MAWFDSFRQLWLAGNKISGKSRTFIADIERGRKVPSLKTLEIIAEALEVKPYELLISEIERNNNAYESFALRLQSKIDPGLFKAIEKYLDETL